MGRMPHATGAGCLETWGAMVIAGHYPVIHMKRLYPLMSLALILGGCLPEERIWWSPDGQQAIVFVEGGLHLAQPGGELGPPLAGDATDKSTTPKSLSWLRDGSGFVLCRERKIATWKEVARLIPAGEAKKIELLARTVPALLAGANKLTGKPSEAEALLSSTVSGNENDFLIALLCAYQQQKAAVGKSLLKLPGGADLLKKLDGENSRFTVNEICVVKLESDRSTTTPQSLARSLYAMALPRVSPTQNAVAWLHQRGTDQAPSIEASSLDGRDHLTVCQSAKASFDWSPDGRSILFAIPAGSPSDSLAKIQKVAVVAESGTLIKQASEELGMAVLLDPPRLQALPDGRILFSSQTATLPSAGPSPQIAAKFFLLSADGKTIDAVATAPGALPADLSFFAASPDGKFAAVVDSGNDAVTVVDLATGAAEAIVPASPDWHCRTMPAWKAPGELTFAGLHNGAPQWMLWSKSGGILPLSEKWPAKATDNWLENKQEQKNGDGAEKH